MASVIIVNIPTSDNTMNDIENYLRNKDILHLCKRGDLIENTYDSGYRMSGVYIIDTINDTNIVKNISYDSDDYGAVPENFNIFEHFEPDHFIKADFKNAYWHLPLTTVSSSKMNTSNLFTLDEKIIYIDNNINIFETRDPSNIYNQMKNGSLVKEFEIYSSRKYSSINHPDSVIRKPLETIFEEEQSISEDDQNIIDMVQTIVPVFDLSNKSIFTFVE